MQDSVPRGVIEVGICFTPPQGKFARAYAASMLYTLPVQVNRCLSIKGAEDAINKPYAFEISTTDSNMYFVADKDKV